MNTPIELTQGLDLKAPDERDLSLHAVFGSVDVGIIPTEEWLVGNFFFKNQHYTDMCTGFGLAAVREDTEDVELSPEWLFAQIKKLRGDPMGYGGDLNTGLKVATKLGAIEKVDAPFDVDSKDRNFLALAQNWPPGLVNSAKAHIGESFFNVLKDSPYDTFDAIRAALWANRAERRSVYTGCMWRKNWLYAKNGVIPSSPVPDGIGHCFKIANGQKIINGQPYLIVQNSAGKNVGDNGFFYMPRAVANRELKFGAYMVKDMPRDVAEHLNGQYTEYKSKSFFAKLMNLLKDHFNL